MIGDSLSVKGAEFIASHEGFRSAPYLCPAGVPTIGYGCTYYPGGQRVTLNDPPITTGDAWNVLVFVADAMAEEIKARSSVALTGGQLDALTSFAFNFGPARLFGSTLWRKLQASDVAGAAAQFQFWRMGVNKETGRREVMPGLVTRRAAERAMFLA